MTSNTRSALPAFLLAGLAFVLAVVTGVEWLGKPLRMTQVLTIIGLGMTAGVSWMQADGVPARSAPEVTVTQPPNST